MVEADDDLVLVKGVGLALAPQSIVGLGFEDHRGQVELLLQLLLPLTAKGGGENQQDSPPALGPLLG